MFFSGKVPKISEKPEPRALGIWSAKQSSEPGGYHGDYSNRPWYHGNLRVSPPRKTAGPKGNFLKTLGIPFFRAWLYISWGAGGIGVGVPLDSHERPWRPEKTLVRNRFPGRLRAGSWKRTPNGKGKFQRPGNHRVFGFHMVPAVRFSGVSIKTSLTSYITSILSMRKSYLFLFRFINSIFFWHTKKILKTPMGPTFHIRNHTQKMPKEALIVVVNLSNVNDWCICPEETPVCQCWDQHGLTNVEFKWRFFVEKSWKRRPLTEGWQV